MNPEVNFPKRLIRYVNETGVRAFDRLADRFESPAAGKSGQAPEPSKPAAALASLVENWKAMSAEDKEQFVGRISTAAFEVIVASAALPVGLKLGRKAVKAGRKVIRKQVKRIRKAAKKKKGAAPAAGKPKKKAKAKKK